MIRELRDFTMARVGLARAGNSMTTRDLLEFQLAHARARDAVHGCFDSSALAAEIEGAGFKTIVVASAARTRGEYLRHPDLGRSLDPLSREKLSREVSGSFDAIFAVADGLSPHAVQKQAAPLIRAVADRLNPGEWRMAPVAITTQGRVAISDEIGEIVKADLAVMLIGERPGLSSFDSMGAYLTWSPRRGRTDAERNCISNIRPEGLSIAAAAELLLILMKESRARRLSGVALKPEATGRLSPSA